MSYFAFTTTVVGDAGDDTKAPAHSLANVSANAEDDWLTELGYPPGAIALQ